MNVKPLLRASLLGTSFLLHACADVLESPEDALPLPVDLGNPAAPPAPSPAPTPAATIPTKAQLLGSWLLVRENGAAVTSTVTITFLNDNTYIQGGEQNTADCNPTPATAGTFANYDGNGNGVEFGEYSYNETTGSLSASNSVFFIDSNGDCGLHEVSTGATQDPFNLTLSGGVLRGAEAAGGFTAEFTRIERGTGVTGSWYLTTGTENTPDGGNPVVISLLSDGRFVLLCPEPELPMSATNSGADTPGAQVGRYAVDASGNLTVSSVTTNTASCSIGPIDGDGGPTGNTAEQFTVNASGELIYSYIFNAAAESAGFSPLPLANRFDVSLLSGLWYETQPNSTLNENLLRSLAFFGPDNLFLLGAENNDVECTDRYVGTGVTSEVDGNGFERGVFSVDPTTGRLVTTITAETDGACGTYDRTRLNQRFYVYSLDNTQVGVRMTNEEEQGNPDSILQPMPSTSGQLFGGWRGTTDSTGATPDDFVIAYYDDTTAGGATGFYMAVDANPDRICTGGNGVDPGPAGGIEVGFYNFDGVNIQYTTSGVGSTQCVRRLQPADPRTFSFTPDFLRYSDSQASTPPLVYVYDKLATP